MKTSNLQTWTVIVELLNFEETLNPGFCKSVSHASGVVSLEKATNHRAPGAPTCRCCPTGSSTLETRLKKICSFQDFTHTQHNVLRWQEGWTIRHCFYSPSPFESTSGIDFSDDESSSSLTSLHVDCDDTNLTCLTMMSSTKMLYWLEGIKHEGCNASLNSQFRFLPKEI